MTLKHLPCPSLMMSPSKALQNNGLRGKISALLLHCLLALCLLIGTMPHVANAQVVNTLAGDGTNTFLDGTGTGARFDNPYGVCSDGAGNLFVADAANNRIRKIIISTGVVTTLAGDGTNGFLDGTGTGARFGNPYGVCSDGIGNLFIADFVNHRIRKIVISTGVVTTLAGDGTNGFLDGTGTGARFAFPRGVCSDGAGNLFVADRNNNRIRKIVIATGVVTTLAGNGTNGFLDGIGTGARFDNPFGVCSDGAGNLFVADVSNNRIRKIVIATGVVTTLAGDGINGSVDGTGTAARFSFPAGICSDGAGNLFVADQINHRIRRIVIATGVVTTLAGSTMGFADGLGTAAQFDGPTGLASDVAGNLFVADRNNHRIRRIAPLFQGITSFTPTSGGAGTTVVITGAGFTGATAVSFGGIPAASFTVNSDTQITAVLGSGTPGSGGQQLVVVTSPTGTLSLGGFFIGATVGTPPSSGTPPTTGVAQPAIIGGISPNVLTFGTPVTIMGSGFTGATGFLIGGVAITNFRVVGDNMITGIVGGVPVNDRVQLVGGLGANLDMSGLGLIYTRLVPPSVANIFPASLVASGDDAQVTLLGFNFAANARVLVSERSADRTFDDGQPIPIQSLSSTQAVVTLSGVFRSPGEKRLTLVNPDGQAAASVVLTVVTGAAISLTNTDNVLLAVSTTASGRAFSVRLTGANIFRTVRAVVGDIPARVTVPSSTEALVEVPASLNEVGGITLTIRLTNTDGQSTSASVRIARRPPPTIVSVTVQGGGRLVVRGVNFLGGIRSQLGSTPLTILSQEDDTQFTAQIPPSFRLTAIAQTVLLSVQNTDGGSHAVLLPRSLFEGEFSALALYGGSAGQTWYAGQGQAPVEWTSLIAEKQKASDARELSASQELSVYPNPVDGELRIGGTGLRVVRVLDMRGIVILEERTVSGVIDTQRLSAGAYMVMVEAEGKVFRRLVVKR